ncbi:RNA polymerase sigma factor [Streptomyces tirandamycinicus]|uniref:RNA polymerase sigma factor n=1 Tax=Streptomyces tirandamycinicus TaxID=2174846 RepID=UPI00226EF05B|nr:sigma-70 family RNA polymerase sigma factor [Streptomyces tirandamycinicus]MCY0981310.1 sigma-70 family RNA polymerase sigma factor [Streptomyces tirandamycinicus]
MATDTQTAHSGAEERAARGGPREGASQERWQRAWSHREDLLKVARRRSMSQEDAEDAVHEAMLRAAENPHLDDDRLGAWLTTVTMRLCVDRYRQVNREAEVRSSPLLVAPRPAPVDEVVCDRAEAKWLAVRSGELPARQAEALRLKSEDLDVGEVAREMGLSYRTVESLLARARRTLRASLAGTLGVVLWLLGRRPRTGGNAHLVVAASTAATLAAAGFVVPYAQEGDGPGPSPGTSETADVRTAGDGAGRGGEERGGAGQSVPTGPLPAPPGVPGAPGGGLPVPLLPGGPALPSLPPVAVPAVPAPAVPSVPEMPGIPVTPGIPELPDASGAPRLPEASGVPELPELPGGPGGAAEGTPGLPRPTATAPAAPAEPALPSPPPAGPPPAPTRSIPGVPSAAPPAP